MRLIMILIIFLLSFNLVEALRINEIMYNPEGNEFDFEYLELYSEEIINVTNYYFEGIDFTFPNYEFQGYIIVANTKDDEGPNNDFNDKYGVEANFDFSGSLSNGGERIAIYNEEGSVVDEITYDDSAQEDYSLEYQDGSFLQSSFKGGSPGEENSLMNEEENSVSEINNQTSENQSNCDLSIQIETEKIIYEEGESIKYEPIITGDSNYEIEYYITDINGNFERDKRTTTNDNKKTFSPKIDEADKIFFIHMNLTPECEDLNLENNYANKSVILRKEIEEIIKNSKTRIEITDVDLGSDNKAFFGETIKVDINVEIGNSTKRTLKVYLDKISEAVSIEIKDDQEITIPLSLFHNCNDNYMLGSYPIVAEGFDTKDFKTIYVEGVNEKNCEDYLGFEDFQFKEETKLSKSKDPEIISFYTRNKIFEENKTINLYTNIDSKNQDFKSIILHNGIKIFDESREEKYNTSISLAGGNNTIILELYSGNEKLGQEELSFYVEPLEDSKEEIISGERFKKPNLIQNVGDGSEDEESFKKPNLISYMLMALSMGLNMVLIWKR